MSAFSEHYYETDSIDLVRTDKRIYFMASLFLYRFGNISPKKPHLTLLLLGTVPKVFTNMCLS